MERTQIRYACLARVVREGGFKVCLSCSIFSCLPDKVVVQIALIIRLSLIPGHCESFDLANMG